MEIFPTAECVKFELSVRRPTPVRLEICPAIADQFDGLLPRWCTPLACRDGIAPSAYQEGRRYRVRRRAIDSAPFSSLATGRVS
jgi:hypothetical protein